MMYACQMICPLGVVLLLTNGAMAPKAFAQGTDSSTNPAQSDSRSQVREGEARQKGQVAHVGAGTTETSTTGHSGPTQQSSGPTGEITVPPPPNASLCDSYKDTAAHQGCLQVVLRQEQKPQ
jgi:hypothetical protein